MSNEKLKVIIDTDPGIDDAMAILFLSKIKDIDILGFTTVDGNVSLKHTTSNMCYVRQLINRADIPIYKGESKPICRVSPDGGNVHGKDGLGGCNYTPKSIDIESISAVDYLVKSVKENPGEITILTLGPLSNIAKAVQLDPSFAANVKQLVVMGASECSGNITPQAEFNFAHDPEAAKIVLSADFKPIILIGLDVAMKVFFSPNERELVRHIKTDEAQFIYNITESYMDFWFDRNHTLGFEVCDPMAAMYLVKPEIFKLTEAYVDVETSGLCDGCSVVYRKEIYKDVKVNAKIATDINTKKALNKLLSTLFPHYKKDIKKLLSKEYN